MALWEEEFVQLPVSSLGHPGQAVPCLVGRNLALWVCWLDRAGLRAASLLCRPLVGSRDDIWEKSGLRQMPTWEPDFLVWFYLLVACQVFITGFTWPIVRSHSLLTKDQDPRTTTSYSSNILLNIYNKETAPVFVKNFRQGREVGWLAFIILYFWSEIKEYSYG